MEMFYGFISSMYSSTLKFASSADIKTKMKFLRGNSLHWFSSAEEEG